MCVIVDTNCAHKALRSPCDVEYAPVFKWINDGKGKLIYGGKLRTELEKDAKSKRLIRQWSLAGKAILFRDEDLALEQERLRGTGLMKSNDPHNLALAIVSRTKTMCTEDNRLWVDFKNVKLVCCLRNRYSA